MEPALWTTKAGHQFQSKSNLSKALKSVKRWFRCTCHHRSLMVVIENELQQSNIEDLLEISHCFKLWLKLFPKVKLKTWSLQGLQATHWMQKSKSSKLIVKSVNHCPKLQWKYHIEPHYFQSHIWHWWPIPSFPLSTLSDGWTFVWLLYVWKRSPKPQNKPRYKPLTHRQSDTITSSICLAGEVMEASEALTQEHGFRHLSKCFRHLKTLQVCKPREPKC